MLEREASGLLMSVIRTLHETDTGQVTEIIKTIVQMGVGGLRKCPPPTKLEFSISILLLLPCTSPPSKFSPEVQFP